MFEVKCDVVDVFWIFLLGMNIEWIEEEVVLCIVECFEFYMFGE